MLNSGKNSKPILTDATEYVHLWVCEVRGRTLLSPWLAAEHAHASHVDAYQPPRHQVFKGSQRSYKSVWVGAVGIPVSRIDSQTAGAARATAVTRRLKEVLLLVDVVDVHVWEHCHLVAWDVRGLGFVAHPDADALTYWVHAAVLRLPRSPAGPSPADLWCSRLCIGRLSAEEHPGWEVVALFEEFGVHCGNGVGVTWLLLLLLRRCGRTRVPCDGGHSLGTEEEEQDQHGRPHGHTTWGWGQRRHYILLTDSLMLNTDCLVCAIWMLDTIFAVAQ